MASIEALWSVRFESSFGFDGGGVVVFETGRVFGGDSAWYYVGDYCFDDNEIVGKVRVRHHGDENILTIFENPPGESPEIELRGNLLASGDKIEAYGEVVGRPDVAMKAVFKRLEDLP